MVHLGNVSRYQIGHVFNRTYRIESLLGGGGMGLVFEVTHLRLGRRLALKLIAGAAGNPSESYVRFHREAMITGQLGNPHIVDVVDFDETPERVPYIVMELLDGEDLAALLGRERRLNLWQAASIVRQCASALAAAHEQGIVHRDLKPSNIFLCRRGERADYVKVLDFGISKMLGDSSTTRTHALIGTPSYMSPEQASQSNDEVDARADLFAMGSITYQMLAGEPPFSGNSAVQVLYAVVYKAPTPLHIAAPAVPPEVARVIHRSLSKEPDERYQTMHEFSVQLTAAVRDAVGLEPSHSDEYTEDRSSSWVQTEDTNVHSVRFGEVTQTDVTPFADEYSEVDETTLAFVVNAGPVILPPVATEVPLPDAAAGEASSRASATMEEWHGIDHSTVAGSEPGAFEEVTAPAEATISSGRLAVRSLQTEQVVFEPPTSGAAGPAAAGSPAPPTDTLVGSTLAGYRITAERDCDEIGETYDATRLSDDRTVSLWSADTGRFDAELQVTRFLDHARVLAQVRHPSLLQVIDSGVENGRVFLAAAPRTGQPLREHFRRNALDPARAAEIVRELAEALDAAHSVGLTHGALCPGALEACSDPEAPGGHRVRIHELAVGRLRRALLARPDAARERGRRNGALHPHPAGARLDDQDYAAPALIGDKTADPSPADDVFSLGCVLCELACGTPPFTAADAKHAAGPAQERLAELPPTLAAVIRRALAPRREERHASASELAHDLSLIASCGPTIDPPAARTTTLREDTSPVAAADEPCGLPADRGSVLPERVQADPRALSAPAWAALANAFAAGKALLVGPAPLPYPSTALVAAWIANPESPSGINLMAEGRPVKRVTVGSRTFREVHLDTLLADLSEHGVEPRVRRAAARIAADLLDALHTWHANASRHASARPAAVSGELRWTVGQRWIAIAVRREQPLPDSRFLLAAAVRSAGASASACGSDAVMAAALEREAQPMRGAALVVAAQVPERWAELLCLADRTLGGAPPALCALTLPSEAPGKQSDQRPGELVGNAAAALSPTVALPQRGRGNPAIAADQAAPSGVAEPGAGAASGEPVASEQPSEPAPAPEPQSTPPQRISLEGQLGRNTDFAAIYGRSGTLRLDLGAVVGVDPYGLRAWLGACSTASPALRLIIERCPPAVVKVLVAFPGIVQQGHRVASVLAPYYCHRCDEAFQLLVELDGASDPASHQVPVQRCPGCGGELLLDEDPASFFSVGRAPAAD